MGLLDKSKRTPGKKKKANKIITANDIVMENDTKTVFNNSKVSAKERKPIQVNPTTLNLVRRLSYAKGIPMYQVVDVALESLLEHDMTPQEKFIFEHQTAQIERGTFMPNNLNKK